MTEPTARSSEVVVDAGCGLGALCRDIVNCARCRGNERTRRYRRGLPPLPRKPLPDPEKLFWEKVDKSGDCWEWTGCITPGGYGKVGVRAKTTYAHRYSYTLAKGPIPDGLVLDHLCKNTRCVRPDHLEAVTTRENVLRSDNFAAHEARKTECIHGHPFDDENTYWWQGHRYCRTCRSKVWSEWFKRSKALT